MKKYKIKSFVYSIALSLIMLIGCTDLDVPVISELTPDTFPKTEEDFISVTGAVYYFLHYKYFTINQILIQELSGDCAVLTANGGNWYDDGRYQRWHLHQPNADQRFLRESWTAWFNGISKINSVLSLLEETEDSDAKKMFIAEMRVMRAYFYFIIQDMWGGVPIYTDFGSAANVKARDSRTDVCQFIEDEVVAALPDLTEETGINTYTRPTKWMANALLAKLYMNWAEYTGQAARWNDAVAACDVIIAEAESGSDKIALDADYIKMFYPDNGPQFKDILFAIPCDGEYMKEHIPARYWLNSNHRYVWDLPFGPSGCVKVWPEYYDKFTAWGDNDVRKNVWLTGKQYHLDGTTPVIVNTTNSGLDNRYDGPEPDAAVEWHLELTREIEFRDLETFDTGNDQVGKAVGYRCNKFYPDQTSITRNQNNDLPIFRYADVLLMKAEALLRGAGATMGHTAEVLANRVRERAGATPYGASTLTLDELLDERARELVYEGWRRNDLIRFGKYETPWGVKTETNTAKRIMPIPTQALQLNTLLVQNPSY